MSTRAHVFVIIVALLALAFVLFLVRRHTLKSKYSLLWLAISMGFLAVALFPNAYDRLSDATGIDYPPATILFGAVVFLFVIVVHFSWELSRLEERSRIMAEELALLRARHDEVRARAGAPAGPQPDDDDVESGGDGSGDGSGDGGARPRSTA